MRHEDNEQLQGNGLFNFFGEGSKFFGIVVINFLLTLITLGLYYPWAKARTRQYLWSETEFEGSPFTFHGTGREMFRGFIIAYGILVAMVLLSAVIPFGA